MLAQSGNPAVAGSPSSHIKELEIDLPAPPTPLGAYIESSEAGNLLFLSGVLPVANGKLVISGRLGENLSADHGREAARAASLNVLAVVKQHLGTLERVKKLIKLTVQLVTTEEFTDHASVADGASNFFAQVFGHENGHVRLVYGVQSLPLGAPLVIETIFEIEPAAIQR